MGDDGPDYSNVAAGGQVNVTHPMHASQHENGGSDEIDVSGLSGELADNQPFAAHALAGAKHTAATLAALNAKISDATLDDASDTRTPEGHKASHAELGSDKLKYTRQAIFYISGTLETGANQSVVIRYRGLDATIVRADAAVKTAPTGADLIFDININGTSIWDSTQANRVKIIATNSYSTQTAFDTTVLRDNELVIIDIDQIGSTVAGADATVLLELEVNLEAD